MAITSFIRNAKPQTTTLLQTGMTFDVNGTSFNTCKGISQKSIYAFEICPAALNETCVANPQAITTSGFATLNKEPTYNGFVAQNGYSTPATWAFMASNITEINGVSAVAFDCERTASLTVTGDVTTNTETIYCILSGFDFRFIPMTTLIPIPAATAVNTVIKSYAPITYIQHAYFTGAISTGTSVISLGSANQIGLPHFIKGNQLISIGNGYADSLFTTSEISASLKSGYNWRTANLPDAVSGEEIWLNNGARGYIDFTPTGTSVAITGNQSFIITYYANGGDSELSNQLLNSNFESQTDNYNKVYNVGSFGVLGCAVTNSGKNVAYPKLTSHDVVGITYSSGSLTSYGQFSPTSPDMIFYQKYLNTVANT